MENGWIVIGIGGATCSGKTSLATELHSNLLGSIIFHQDDYYHEVGNPMLEYIDEVQHYNWDVISAIDTDRLIGDVKRIISTVADMSVVVIEGTLVLNDSRIRDLCTLKYFFTLPYEISRNRRYQKRFDIPDPPMNFERVIWPMYLKNKSELTDSSIKFVDSYENDITTIYHIILTDISNLCLRLSNVNLIT